MPGMDDTELVGRQAALEALVWALVRTHPDPAALIEAFQENADILRTHFLNQPVNDAYVAALEEACSRINERMAAK